MIRLLPCRSPLPWLQAFAVVSSIWLSTVTPASDTSASESPGKNWSCSSGAASTQTATPAVPLMTAIAAIVAG
jgi:hypothetical protein